jgi:predicted cytidylate kinase
MILSLAGDPGSGKTSVAKILAERLGYRWYSIGDLRGKMAVERGMTLEEFNAWGETHPESDSIVDAYQKKLGQTEDRFIIDGKLAWYFIPHSFKLFLQCDLDEAARRIFAAHLAKDASRADESGLQTREAVRASLDRRIASDRLRYQKHYGVTVRDPSHYDLLLDTTHCVGPEETVEKILLVLKKRGLV